jgi:hypothetical protein
MVRLDHSIETAHMIRSIGRPKHYGLPTVLVLANFVGDFT